MIIFLISWDKSFFCFLWSMLSVEHTMSPNNTVITWSPIHRPTDWLQDYRHLWCWLVDTPWINMPLWSHYFHSFPGVPSFLSRPVSCIYFLSNSLEAWLCHGWGSSRVVEWMRIQDADGSGDASGPLFTVKITKVRAELNINLNWEKLTNKPENIRTPGDIQRWQMKKAWQRDAEKHWINT